MTGSANAIGPAAPSPLAVTVLVADDHQVVSAALTMALRGEGLDAHALCVTGGEGVLAQTVRHRPGLVLLDLDLGARPDGRPHRGAELVTELRAAGWCVVILTGSGNRSQIAAAVAAGAAGWISKSAPFSALITAVREAAAGGVLLTPHEREAWMSEHRSVTARHRKLDRRLGALSPRERQVLERLADGHRAGAIAEEFVVSLATVRSQIRSILTKLEVSSQLEAVAALREWQHT